MKAAERELLALGDIKRILRLGPLHGLDDPYYVERFDAELWAQGESETYPEPKIAQKLAADRALPFPDAELFAFEGTKQPESALLIRRDPGILLTCDSIQHYGDYRHNTLTRSARHAAYRLPEDHCRRPDLAQDHDAGGRIAEEQSSSACSRWTSTACSPPTEACSLVAQRNPSQQRCAGPSRRPELGRPVSGSLRDCFDLISRGHLVGDR